MFMILQFFPQIAHFVLKYNRGESARILLFAEQCGYVPNRERNHIFWIWIQI